MSIQNFIKTAILAALLTCGTSVVSAQSAFEHLSVGLEAGTYGPGLTVATTLTPNLLLRGGIGYASSSYNPEDMTYDVTGHVSYTPDDIDMILKINKLSADFLNFRLGFEYYPMRNGIFSIGAGAYFGESAIPVEGKVNDYKTFTSKYGEKPYFTFDDVVIVPEDDGSMTGKIKLGTAIKPYFVLSLGRSIATDHRVSFKFDLGLIYQGKIQLSSDNSSRNLKFSDIPDEDRDEYLDSPLLKLWPVLNFTLAYRIF